METLTDIARWYARRVPLSGLLTRLLEDPTSDINIKPVSSSKGDELARKYHASHWMMPTQKGLYSTDGAVLQINDGLVEQEEVRHWRRADCRSILSPRRRAQRIACPGLERCIAVLSQAPSGPIESDVGVAQQGPRPTPRSPDGRYRPLADSVSDVPFVILRSQRLAAAHQGAVPPARRGQPPRTIPSANTTNSSPARPPQLCPRRGNDRREALATP